MSVNDESKPKPMAFRRSSLKSKQPLKFDPGALLKPKDKRNSVSWGKSNTFEFKAMKAMFKEGEDLNKKETEEDKEKHQQFLKNRKASIKNEFSLIKELMKKNSQPIIEEEENDEEAKKNMQKNLEMGKEALNEVSESSHSSDKESDNEKKSESKNSSKSGSKNSSKKGSNNSSRNESDNEKDKKEEKNKKVSKLKNKKNFKEEEKDIKEEKVQEQEKEKITIKKKPKFAEKEIIKKENQNEKNEKEDAEKKEGKVNIIDDFKEKEEIKEQKNDKDKQNESEKKGEEKVRLISLEEANKLELDKIAYIALTDGSIVIIKNQGESLVQDLLKIPNPLINQISKPLHQKSFSQKGLGIPKKENTVQKQNNYQENKYKYISVNHTRNSSYNKEINPNQRTYSISTGYPDNIDSRKYNITTKENLKETPYYSTTFNKPAQVPKAKYSNPDTQRYQYYSNINKTPLSQYINHNKIQRNRSQKNHVPSKSINYYQDQLSYSSNYLNSPKTQYIYSNTRNFQSNYIEPTKKQSQNMQNSRTNYLNYLEYKPSTLRDYNRGTMKVYDTWNNSNLLKFNQSNPRLVKSYYNQNIINQGSQQNNRYQRYPYNLSNRGTTIYHSRINSYEIEPNNQLLESFNDFDNLEEEQYNYENEDIYPNSQLNL
jgi:hypothetical protein